jgi:pseudouridine-5'-phosphate glycosidase
MKIKISKEVELALKNHQPVVALESTIIAHGMPYPKNVETALAVEKVIRDNGAIPATIGIIDGTPIIGMSREEIEDFGTRHDIVKISRRDLPVALTRHLNGDTTVTATMILAHEAGIKVFVTGGIGGVHREYNETMDVSADLVELSKTPVIVICAGIKAILDLNRTLEYLETLGVTVLGYKSKELPDFYTAHSGIALEYSANNPKEISDIMKTKEEWSLEGGVLVTNPIPEKFAANKEEIDAAIAKAIAEAHEKKVEGKNITPFLLGRIAELTNGDSLESNVQLILNNALLGAEVAKEYSK